MKVEGTRCFQVSEDERALTIAIPVDAKGMRSHAGRAFGSLLVFSLMLLGLATGITYEISNAEFLADLGPLLLLALLLPVIATAAAYWGLYGFWRIWGREDIRVADLRLTVSRTVFLFNRSHAFHIDRIDRIEWGEITHAYWALAEHPQPLSTGEVSRLPLESQAPYWRWMRQPYPAIAVTSEGKTHHFAVGMTGGNVVEILHHLAQWLPEGVVKIPGEQGEDEVPESGERLFE
jgi:hypothetical protein